MTYFCESSTKVSAPLNRDQVITTRYSYDLIAPTKSEPTWFCCVRRKNTKWIIGTVADATIDKTKEMAHAIAARDYDNMPANVSHTFSLKYRMSF